MPKSKKVTVRPNKTKQPVVRVEKLETSYGPYVVKEREPRKAIPIAEEHKENPDGSQDYKIEVGPVVDLEILDSIPVSDATNCGCMDFEGQDFFCRIHTPKVLCPRCRCIDTDLLVSKDSVLNHYRCGLCGIFYIRNMHTGETGYN